MSADSAGCRRDGKPLFIRGILKDRFKLFLLTDGETDHDDVFWAVLFGLQNVRNITNYRCHH